MDDSDGQDEDDIGNDDTEQHERYPHSVIIFLAVGALASHLFPSLSLNNQLSHNDWCQDNHNNHWDERIKGGTSKQEVSVLLFGFGCVTSGLQTPSTTIKENVQTALYVPIKA